MNDSQITIVHAALHYDDGKDYENQPKNIKTGIVICDFRHKICLNTLKKLFKVKIINEPLLSNCLVNCTLKLVIKHPSFLRFLEKILKIRIMGRFNLKCGFITSDGRFIDRKKAAKVAWDAGLIKIKVEDLHSEYIFPLSKKLDGFTVKELTI